MNELTKVLMRRDNMTRREAEDLIREARLDLNERLDTGEFVDDQNFMEEWFGLEPDYLFDVIEM